MRTLFFLAGLAVLSWHGRECFTEAAGLSAMWISRGATSREIKVLTFREPTCYIHKVPRVHSGLSVLRRFSSLRWFRARKTMKNS